MPQDTVETFARGLIDQIVSKAFDKIKIRFKKGPKKIFTAVRHIGTKEILLILLHLSAEVSYSHMQRSDTYTDHNEGEGKEVTESVVHDLRSVQIGDSSNILSCPMSLLDRQVMSERTKKKHKNKKREKEKRNPSTLFHPRQIDRSIPI